MDRIPQSDSSILSIKLDGSQSHDMTEACVQVKWLVGFGVALVTFYDSGHTTCTLLYLQVTPHASHAIYKSHHTQVTLYTHDITCS